MSLDSIQEMSVTYYLKKKSLPDQAEEEKCQISQELQASEEASANFQHCEFVLYVILSYRLCISS